MYLFEKCIEVEKHTLSPLSLLSLQSEFLSANQCNEWRGMLIVTYIALHYCGIDKVNNISRANRFCVSKYVCHVFMHSVCLCVRVYCLVLCLHFVCVCCIHCVCVLLKVGAGQLVGELLVGGLVLFLDSLTSHTAGNMLTSAGGDWEL